MPPIVGPLSGKLAFVSGGSSDIGRAICLRLARDGAQLAFSYFSDHGRSSNPPSTPTSWEHRRSASCASTSGDEASSAELIQRAQTELPRVDLLVPQRRLRRVSQRDRAFKPTSQADLRRQRSLACDLGWRLRRRAPRRTPAAASWLGDCGDQLAGAVRAIPQYAALGASKAALESIARHLALELGPHGIRVNVVSPGIVQTRALAHLPHRDQLLDIAARRTPLARLCTPNDVAEVVAFLGSPAAAMIHGQTLHVDGGYSIVGWVGASGPATGSPAAAFCSTERGPVGGFFREGVAAARCWLASRSDRR